MNQIVFSRIKKELSSLKKLKKKRIIICDWDNTLQETEYYLFKYFDIIFSNKKKNKIIDQKIKKYKTYLQEEFLSTEQTYIWQMVRKNKNILWLEKEIMRSFMSDALFYFNSEFFSILNDLLYLLANKKIDLLVFLSHTPRTGNVPEKRKFEQCEKKFSSFSDKIMFGHIPYNKSKGKWINTHFPDYFLMIDDSASVLTDIVLNTYCKNKFFLVPVQKLNKKFVKRLLNCPQIKYSGLNILLDNVMRLPL